MSVSKRLRVHGQLGRRWAQQNAIALGVTGLGFLLITLFFLDRIFVTIPPGHGGVMWERLFGGTVTERVFGEGLHVIMPFNQMFAYDTRLQEVTEKYDAISSDGLVMQVELSIRFRLVERNVGYLHKFIGPDYVRKLIVPELAAHMRTVISNYTPEDLYSRKRQKIQKEIFEQVSRQMETLYDPDQPSRRFVVVETVLIRGVVIPTRVKDAIESKIEQFHKMLEYDYRIQREAKESIRKHIEAEGIRKFQEVVSQGITKDLLTWKGIEATLALSRSDNAKVVVIGSGKNGLPVILNADSPESARPPRAGREQGTGTAQLDAEEIQTNPEDLDAIAHEAPRPAKPLQRTPSSAIPKVLERLLDSKSSPPPRRTRPMGSDFYLDRQEARESNAKTYARSLHLALTQAKGIMVTDADGKRYYDCLSAAGTLVLGHKHPVVKEALKQAIDADLPMQLLDLASPVKDAFVEEIFDSLPASFARRARIQFCGPTGADGVEAAVKLVKTATGSSGMMAFHGAYHGMTHATLAISGNLAPRAGIGGLMAGVQFMPFPQSYRCPFGVGGEQGHSLSSRYIESTLADPESGVSPAGLIVELVQGEGGVNAAPLDWIREIRRITRAQNVPLILDEVQTGGGRTGKLWAFEHAGIEPDVIVMSKAIGGGLPMSVVVYDEKYDHWRGGAHAGTFRGNQLAMAAGLATLRFIRSEGLAAHAAAMGARLAANLRQLQGDFPFLGDVRGLGLMLGVEIVDPDQPAGWQGVPPADPDRARRLRKACLERGLILELGGRFSAVVRFLPPLIVTAAQVDEISTIFAAAVRAVHA
jgi:diaminobutyrate-2-oxoglutarate transaminase